MIRIALADDHTLFRQSFSYFLKSSGLFEIIIEAADGQSLLDQILSSPVLPDIIFLDIQMPVMDGKETTIFIKSIYPNIKIIAISAFDHEDLIDEMLYYGASGFVTKNISYDTLEPALEAILNDQIYVMGADLKPKKYQPNANIKILKQKILTSKQKIFLEYAATGLAYKEIGDKMKISLKTVDRYRDDLFHKLNVKNRVELTLYAMKNGFIDMLPH